MKEESTEIGASKPSVSEDRRQGFVAVDGLGWVHQDTSVRLGGQNYTVDQLKRYGYVFIHGLGWVNPSDSTDSQRIRQWWNAYADYM